MATTVDFIEFVMEQLKEFDNKRYRKMFGEYMVYVNDKPVLLVCDNTVYVKKLECVYNFMTNASCGIPYNGAKEHYILDIDDQKLSTEIVTLLEMNTLVPKKKVKKTIS